MSILNALMAGLLGGQKKPQPGGAVGAAMQAGGMGPYAPPPVDAGSGLMTMTGAAGSSAPPPPAWAGAKLSPDDQLAKVPPQAPDVLGGTSPPEMSQVGAKQMMSPLGAKSMMSGGTGMPLGGPQLFAGGGLGVMAANIAMLRQAGYSEADAYRMLAQRRG